MVRENLKKKILIMFLKKKITFSEINIYFLEIMVLENYFITIVGCFSCKDNNKCGVLFDIPVARINVT